jgi:hypothetical protein
MAKNNQKCVRMDDEILRIVENVKGDGFNNKFEKLVLEYHKSIPEREKYLANLEEQIQTKLKNLADIEKRINGLKNLEFSLDNLRRDILRITDSASSIVNVSQIKAAAPAPEGENEIQTKRRKKCIS